MAETARRILILTLDAGFGHRSAANAIEAALLSAYGERVRVVIENPLASDKCPGWLARSAQQGYDRLVKEAPEIYKIGYDLSDSSLLARIAENMLQPLLFAALRDCFRRNEPDLIVVTNPMYTAALGPVFFFERKRVPVIVTVTDLASVHQIWFSDEADLTVVPTEAVRDLALGAGLAASGVEVLGIPVHPRIAAAAEDPRALRAELGWERDSFAVLAVGSHRVAKLPEILRALNHSGLPIQIAAVAGGDEGMLARLQAEEWHRPTKLYGFVRNMPQLLRASDLVLTKAGGLIVTESLAAGRPLLLVDMLPGQEVGNAEYVVNGGAGEMTTEPLACLETLCHWLADGGKILGERRARAAALGRPRSALDIAERAWELAARGPVRRDSLLAGSRIMELFKRFGVRTED